MRSLFLILVLALTALVLAAPAHADRADDLAEFHESLVSVIATGERLASEARGESPVPGQINAFCAAKWTDDYRMQAYCRKKELAAWGDASTWARDNSVDFSDGVAGPHETILAKCLQKWGLGEVDGWQWSMVWHCTEKQAEAYQSLK